MIYVFKTIKIEMLMPKFYFFILFYAGIYLFVCNLQDDRQVLGSLQKGSFNIVGSELEIVPLTESNRKGISWMIR